MKKEKPIYSYCKECENYGLACNGMTAEYVLSVNAPSWIAKPDCYERDIEES